MRIPMDCLRGDCLGAHEESMGLICREQHPAGCLCTGKSNTDIRPEPVLSELLEGALHAVVRNKGGLDLEEYQDRWEELHALEAHLTIGLYLARDFEEARRMEAELDGPEYRAKVEALRSAAEEEAE